MITIKNIVLGIAIFVLTMFVGIYGISTLYEKAPRYDDFCPSNLFTEEMCLAEGGVWISNTNVIIENIREPSKPVPAEGGYCQYDYTSCQKEFESAEEKYHRKVFFIAIPLGVVIIAVGALIFGLEVVGSGLMAGGVGIIIYGIGGYWQYTKDWLKFAISLIGLVAVIWLAYYANKRWRKRDFVMIRK